MTFESENWTGKKNETINQFSNLKYNFEILFQILIIKYQFSNYKIKKKIIAMTQTSLKFKFSKLKYCKISNRGNRGRHSTYTMLSLLGTILEYELSDYSFDLFLIIFLKN